MPYGGSYKPVERKQCPSSSASVTEILFVLSGLTILFSVQVEVHIMTEQASPRHVEVPREEDLKPPVCIPPTDAEQSHQNLREMGSHGDLHVVPLFPSQGEQRYHSPQLCLGADEAATRSKKKSSKSTARVPSRISRESMKSIPPDFFSLLRSFSGGGTLLLLLELLLESHVSNLHADSVTRLYIRGVSREMHLFRCRAC